MPADVVPQTIAAVAALGTLAGGIGQLANAWRLRSRKDTMPARRAIVAAVVLLALSIGLSTFLIAAPQSLNERLTAEAWEAFNRGDHGGAITKAKSCIDEFRGRADREQSALVQKGVETPPVGKVSDAEKATLLSRGLLNDVATCYFIIGRSEEQLGHAEAAAAAYQSATRYPHAVTWDPGGFFWSPAEAAKDRLGELQKN